MPAPLRIAAHLRDASLTDLGREHRAKPVPPEPDGLVADVDPALGQEVFDVAQRQRVSHVHHHDQTDDLRRAVEISERVAHGLKLPRRERTACSLSDNAYSCMLAGHRLVRRGGEMIDLLAVEEPK